jgi:uncharacterized protein (TIGR02099 family)
MRQFNLSLCATWLRPILILGVCLYFALGMLLLALRYVVLPHIDDWRPQIAAQLSQALGTKVELGPVQVRWQGWNPDFAVRDVHLRAADGRDLLIVPSVRARFNWLALLPGRQGLLRLQVQGMDLGVTRLADGRLSLLGQTFGPGQEGAALPPAWLPWLLTQPLIAFHDLTLRWQDQQRGAPELRLEQVEAVLARTRHDGLGLSVSARAVAAGSPRLSLRLQIADAATLRQGRLPAQVQAWLQVARIRPQEWRPWVDVPQALQQGSLDFQAWLQAAGGEPQVTVLAGLEGLDWVAGAAETLQLPWGQAWVQGPLADWRGLWQGQALPMGLAFELHTRGTQLRQPEWFDHPLAFGEVSARGRLSNPGDWTLQLDHAAWRNADIDLQVAGRWQAGGEAGRIDLQGTIDRARLAAIHRYLPREVNEDTRDWLARGLQAGELFNGRWLLRGDLVQFPFGEHPEAGDFRVWGDFRGGRIEFVPGAPREQAWPLLQIDAGTADLHRMDLQLTASQARMEPSSGEVITLSGVRGRIPDLEHEATLQVSGHTSGAGSAYMALMRHSPLDRLLDGLFGQATAEGTWQVPLALTIPLLHSIDTRVQGRVDLHQGGLQFLPQSPAFQAIEGQVHFSEQGIRINEPLKARLLGGDVLVQGSLGGATDAGLSFRGRILADAAARHVGVPGMARLKGSLDYQARLARQGAAYRFSLDSDTRGLALDFPAPLGKPPEEARSLSLRWTDADPQDDVLELDYGSTLRASLRHRRRQADGPYFQSAALGLGRMATMAPGLQIEIAYPLFDLDRWNRLIDEFSIPRRGQAVAGRAATRPLWPDLALLGVQADQLRLLGTRLDHAVLRVVRSPDEQWSTNLRSQQTTGTLKWQERNGRVQGRMSGRFSRLSLGDDPSDTLSLLPQAEPDEEASFDDDLEIPGIVLQADELRLYGHPMGSLALEGTRNAAEHVWQLDNLRIGNEQASLQGTGRWRLRGPERGLDLKAAVKARNLGAWMGQAGWPDILVGGAGELKGQFQWRNLPWTHAKGDLQGDLQIALERGRFVKLGSHTAKLLELLSLQSIARLTRIDQGLAGLPREGFPFDQLQGAVSLDRGRARIRDYKVIGPVGTILLEGDTSILDETLDLQAVIVPNLDVSGAAIAASIAVNPLIGLGTFLTQWVLKQPLARAMTVRYRIQGTWDEPKIQEIPVGAAPPAGPSKP